MQSLHPPLLYSWTGYLNGRSSNTEELPATTEHSRVEAAPPEMVVTATETIRLSSAETGDRIEGATSSS